MICLTLDTPTIPADILYRRDGELVIFEAISQRAQAWLPANISQGVLLIGHTAFIHIDDLADDLETIWNAGLSCTSDH